MNSGTKKYKKQMYWLRSNGHKFFGWEHRNHHKLIRGRRDKINYSVKEKKLKIKEIELRKEIEI